MDGTFLTRDGLRLSCRRRPAFGRLRGTVALLHGLDDHSRSLPYETLGQSLASRGFAVYSFDRRGSGRSEGPRNHAPGWEELRDDLARFVDLVEDATKRLPFLIGLSFGGLQALDFCLHRPESSPGVIALAPALDSSGAPSWLRALLPLLTAIAPRRPLASRLDLDGVVRDVSVRRAYLSDPLWNRALTPALAQATITTIEKTHRRAPQLDAPLLMVHGTADRVVPIDGTRRFFAAAGSTDKRLIEVPGAFHALPLEPEGEALARAMARWMTDREPLRSSGPAG